MHAPQQHSPGIPDRRFHSMPQTAPAGAMYRVRQLCNTSRGPGLLAVSKATLYRMIADGSFPRPVRVSKQCVAWPHESVSSWLEARGRIGAE